ncbi:MAG: glycoside hydrolase family 57 protein [Candidatus Aenigmatarchaeota archaeon]
MPLITLNFQVHQPIRLANFQPDGISRDVSCYFNSGLNKMIFEKVRDRCYLPTTSILLELIDKFKHEKKKFKVNFAITGVFLELCEKYGKDVLENFKQLVKTKQVEIIGETYHHSLASLFDTKEEFIEEINLHSQAMKDFFGVRPKVFVNTEMIYNNVIGRIVEDLGFKAIFTEGAERILGWRSPNYVYVRKFCFPDDRSWEERIRILLRNYRLSDDIGYRFSAMNWDQWPLTADKFAAWLSVTHGECINLFMDFETFGEHQWAESGIFWFLRALPFEILKYENLEFATPSEVVEKLKPVGEIDVFEFSTVSWADMERDVSAWLGNKMQQICFEEVKNLGKILKEVKNDELKKVWKYLLTSDHYYYMCNKMWADGDVHKYFSCFSSPEESFANFMKIVADLKTKIFINTLSSGEKEIK